MPVRAEVCFWALKSVAAFVPSPEEEGGAKDVVECSWLRLASMEWVSLLWFSMERSMRVISGEEVVVFSVVRDRR